MKRFLATIRGTSNEKAATIATPRQILRQGLKNQFGRHHDCLIQAPVNRTIIGEQVVYSLGGLAVLFIGLEVQLDVNAPDYENVPFHLDLANSLRVQPVVRRRDLTRLQRASKCAGESATAAAATM
jgi:hypothetical protein